MRNGKEKTRANDVFSHPVRTLNATELGKIVGGYPSSGNMVKDVSAQDNQVNTMS